MKIQELTDNMCISIPRNLLDIATAIIPCHFPGYGTTGARRVPPFLGGSQPRKFNSSRSAISLINKKFMSSWHQNDDRVTHLFAVVSGSRLRWARGMPVVI